MKTIPQQVSESVRRLNPDLYLQDWNKATMYERPELLKAIVSQKPPKRIRQSTKPLMNKLEAEFLEILKKGDPCSYYLPQSIRFRLANGLWYKPDVVCLESLQVWEVKGAHAFRGGFENLKMAAAKYPEFTWRLVWKQGGIWCEQIVLP